MYPASFSRRALAPFAALALLLSLSSPSLAGLTGQPQPSADLSGRLQSATRQFLLAGGDTGKARPDILLLVEQNPTADVTDLYAPALRDTPLYNGLVDLLSEQATAKKASQTEYTFIVYNLARTHLLRARLYDTSGSRRAFLDAASKTAALFGQDLRDPGAWELKGDIEAERGDIEAASAAYNRVATSGGGRARAQYLIAGALQRVNRPGPAQRAFDDAIRAAQSEGEREMLHLAYQGLAGLLLRQGNAPAALDALARSARATPTDGKPFRYRLEVAQQLLGRGYGREVAAYADAALRVSPDDEGAKALKEAALRARSRR